MIQHFHTDIIVHLFLRSKIGVLRVERPVGVVILESMRLFLLALVFDC